MLVKNGIVISCISRVSDLVEFKTGDLIGNENTEPSMKIVRKTDKINNADGWDRLHLYIFVESDVEKDDYILAESSSQALVGKAKDAGEKLKLIATTNPNYICAKVPKWFVQEYAKQEIVDVFVEYEETKEKLVPKKNKEHFIQLQLVK